MTKPTLDPQVRLVRQDGSTAPQERGRLLTAREVAKEKFRGAVSPAWVRRNAPIKVPMGHSTVLFFESDIDDWIESRREGDSL